MTTKIKPFSTEHTWGDPDNAIDFYEEQVGIEFPQSVIDFLYAVQDEYPNALFNVQPSVTSNYVAIAHEGDRRAWAFVKPDKVAIWVAHSRNAEALRKLHPELTEQPNPTKGTRSFVDIAAKDAMCEGALVALTFASVHAVPVEDDDAQTF